MNFWKKQAKSVLTSSRTGRTVLWTCLEFNRREKKNKRLSIGHLSSAFLILGIGCGLSFATFLLEIITSYIRAKRFTKVGLHLFL